MWDKKGWLFHQPFLFHRNLRNHPHPKQSPISGQHHFYWLRTWSTQSTQQCFNALHRATSISTNYNRRRTGHRAVFQCPVSGYLHFYAYQTKKAIPQKTCFNALYRATSISTIFGGSLMIETKKFQCPVSGYLHFYPRVCKPLKTEASGGRFWT